MVTEKMQPCCARVKAKLGAARNDLRVEAARASTAQSKGKPMDRWKIRVADAKEHVRRAEELIVEHEAEHADDTH